MSSNKLFSITIGAVIIYGYILPYDYLYDISLVTDYVDWFSNKFKAIRNTLTMTTYYKDAILFSSTAIFFIPLCSVLFVLKGFDFNEAKIVENKFGSVFFMAVFTPAVVVLIYFVLGFDVELNDRSFIFARIMFYSFEDIKFFLYLYSAGFVMLMSFFLAFYHCFLRKFSYFIRL